MKRGALVDPRAAATACFSGRAGACAWSRPGRRAADASADQRALPRSGERGDQRGQLGEELRRSVTVACRTRRLAFCV